jgi:hypothetical protein
MNRKNPTSTSQLRHMNDFSCPQMPTGVNILYCGDGKLLAQTVAPAECLPLCGDHNDIAGVSHVLRTPHRRLYLQLSLRSPWMAVNETGVWAQRSGPHTASAGHVPRDRHLEMGSQVLPLVLLTSILCAYHCTQSCMTVLYCSDRCICTPHPWVCLWYSRKSTRLLPDTIPESSTSITLISGISDVAAMSTSAWATHAESRPPKTSP